MTRIIAVPTSTGKLNGHFGHSRQFAMVEIKENGSREVTYIDAPPHRPGLLPRWLAEKGATDVIAGGMGQSQCFRRGPGTHSGRTGGWIHQQNPDIFRQLL